MQSTFIFISAGNPFRCCYDAILSCLGLGVNEGTEKRQRLKWNIEIISQTIKRLAVIGSTELAEQPRTWYKPHLSDALHNVPLLMRTGENSR